ncbi:amidohydrolase family protein [Frankia sp. AgPm24]|uniref:amidohydrolase family protein n=1 Tax=Frankia sp. AgPm24 TaxID=631128 RepID=UPI00200DB325|nr:amidohydrolase family protein [Frankia sp. AgPm24]MCK9921037.1 amidohydrolase family protein [Frankia sp. AgPm24]
MSALLVTGGTVYPADATDRTLPGGAVLAVDATIVAVGTVAEVDAHLATLAPATRADLETVDARGMIVLPGLVNAHWHEMFSMRFPMRGALRPPSDREDRPVFMGAGGDIPEISRMFDSFDPMINAMTPDEGEAIATYSMWTQARGGVTTLGDMGSLNRPASMVAAARRLGIRFSASTWASDAICPPGAATFTRTRDADAVLSEVEALIKLVDADGSGLVRVRPNVAYVTNMTDELGRGMAELTSANGLGFATHVGALRHETEVLRTCYGTTGVRRLADLGLLNDRLTAAHCAFVDDEERGLLQAAGVHISHSPAKYGPSGESSLTETAVVPALRRAGVPVSLSTDGAGLPIAGMAEAMRAAWQMYNEMSADQTEVRPTDALAMATRIAAAGLRWEGVGSLEPGNAADLVLARADDWRYLLNPRPLESFLWLAGSADVDTVIVGGRTLLRGGRGVDLDEAELEARYLEALASFTKRVIKVPAPVVDRVLAAAGR